MEVEFADEDLDRLETERDVTGGFRREVVRGFRRAMQAIRAAVDERDLHRGGLALRKPPERKEHQHSIHIDKQSRLIIEIGGGNAERKIRVIKITDCAQGENNANS